MARLISLGGNFLTAGSWAVVDATSLLDSEAATTQLTTTPVACAASTPGAIVVDGVAVKIASVAGANGTITIELYNSSDSASVKTVTINVADLPQGADATDGDGGWVFFKFDAATTLIAAKNYVVRASVSAGASAVFLFRNATANNWSRLLRTTTTQAPAAGDDMVVMGEHTGAGTGNDITITMDETATTIYGRIDVCKRGTFSYAVAASTNYYLKLGGELEVYINGTFNMGIVASPMPSTSSGVLEFNCGSDGQYGLILHDGCVFKAQGASKASLITHLGGDEAAGQTVISVLDTSGWAANDVLVFTMTGNGNSTSTSEVKTIQSVDSPTQVTLSAGLTSAHAGTAPYIGEVANITRNLKIRSASATNMTYIFIDTTADVDMDYVECRYFGTGTTSKRGFEWNTVSPGALNVNGCSFYDGENYILYAAVNSGNWVFQNNIIHNCNTNVGAIVPVTISGGTGTGQQFNGNLIDKLRVANAGTGITIADDIEMKNNTFSGFDFGVSYNAIDFTVSMTGDVTGNEIHSMNGYALRFQTVALVFENLGWTLWRNSAYAINITAGLQKLRFSALDMDGNGSSGTYPQIDISAVIGWFEILNGTFDESSYGIRMSSGGGFRGLFINTDFGVSNDHGQADIQLGASMPIFELTMIDCTLASATEINDQTMLPPNGYIRSHKHDGGATTFKTWMKYGTVLNESTIRNTASGYSWKLTPNNASNKLRLPGAGEFDTFKAAVNASSLVTVKISLYKDASYAGNAPRLVLKGGLIGGIASDVIASMTAGAEAWEQLTVTGTPNEDGAVEFYVDCDGTAGNVYVDDADISQ